MSDTTREPELLNHKDCLRRAILVLEWYHLGSLVPDMQPESEADRLQAHRAATVRSELVAASSDHGDRRGRVLIQLIRQFAVVRRLPAVVYCRARRPTTVALEILCADATVAIERMLHGNFDERECHRLVRTAGRVASAPLAFCDARQGVLRAKSVGDLARRGYLGVAIVDGSLSPHEIAELERVTAEWPVAVVAQGAGLTSLQNLALGRLARRRDTRPGEDVA